MSLINLCNNNAKAKGNGVKNQVASANILSGKKIQINQAN